MKAKVSKTYMIIFSILTSVATAISVSGCGEQLSSVTGSTAAVTSATEAEQTTPAAVTTQASTEAAKSKRLSEGDVTVNETISDSTDGGHAITADGEEASYSNVLVTKTGEADGDEADFYGENAAIFATNGGTLNLSDMVVKTDHAALRRHVDDGACNTVFDHVFADAILHAARRVHQLQLGVQVYPLREVEVVQLHQRRVADHLLGGIIERHDYASLLAFIA